jgi:DNA-directed RNA polymerase specialized sigma subunit
LAAFEKTYKRQERELERQSEKLREERDKAIRAAYRDDVPMKDIAKVMKLSHQRVSQIVRS